VEFEKCRDILLRETELVQRIAGLQELIREGVLNRDWTDFEAHFNALEEIQGEFASLEGERMLYFNDSSIDTDVSKGFYTKIAGFPAEQRNELSEIFRNLKLEALRVQISGETIMGFIAGARATLSGFFEIAFPDRGGKIYTSYGKPISHDMRSMVLNRIF